MLTRIHSTKAIHIRCPCVARLVHVLPQWSRSTLTSIHINWTSGAAQLHAIRTEAKPINMRKRTTRAQYLAWLYQVSSSKNFHKFKIIHSHLQKHAEVSCTLWQHDQRWHCFVQRMCSQETLHKHSWSGAAWGSTRRQPCASTAKAQWAAALLHTQTPGYCNYKLCAYDVQYMRVNHKPQRQLQYTHKHIKLPSLHLERRLTSQTCRRHCPRYPFVTVVMSLLQ